MPIERGTAQHGKLKPLDIDLEKSMAALGMLIENIGEPPHADIDRHAGPAMRRVLSREPAVDGRDTAPPSISCSA